MITEQDRARACERLAIALDVADVHNGPVSVAPLRRETLRLVDKLRSVGDVYLKIESSLHACGHALIHELHDRRVKVFADFKFFGTTKSLVLDARYLRSFDPEIVTISCFVGEEAMKAFRAELPPSIRVFGITVPTTWKEKECQDHCGSTIKQAVMKYALMAHRAKLDGIVCAATETATIKGAFSKQLAVINPAIRPAGLSVSDDKQNQERCMTPFQALSVGADIIVVGDPITSSSNPFESASRTLDEMASAWADYEPIEL